MNIELNQAQREILQGLYRKKQIKKGSPLVYENQKFASMEVVNHYLEGKLAITLIAEPGAGKTGTFLEIAYCMCTHPNDDLIIPDENVYIITGMCDVDWAEQTKDNMLQSFEKNVYHSGQIHKLKQLIKDNKVNDSLIIIDECHIAAEKEHRMGKMLKELGILNVNYLKDNRIRLLVVSATPDDTYMDLINWKDNEGNILHEKVILKSSNIYKGFKYFKNNKMLNQAKDLKVVDNCIELALEIKEKWKNDTKYHLIRARDDKVRETFEEICNYYDWNIEYHDSEERQKRKKTNVQEIDVMMQTKPKKHTIILIKNMWRAGKRLVKNHVGLVYETKDANITTTAQGLLGRFCCNDREDFSCVFYCNIDAAEKYIKLIDSEFDYENCDNDCTYKKTFTHHTNVEGIVCDEEEKKRDKEFYAKTVPIIINLPEDLFKKLRTLKRDSKYKEIFNFVNNEEDWDPEYNNENLLQVSTPDTESSYEKNIIKYIEAFNNNKPMKPKDILSDKNKPIFYGKKCWGVFIDKYEKRLVIQRWNGTRLSENTIKNAISSC
jgi:superfamily II DNA or RNA helicase